MRCSDSGLAWTEGSPPGVGVSGLESNGADLFYFGGGPSGKVRAVRRAGARKKGVEEKWWVSADKA